MRCVRLLCVLALQVTYVLLEKPSYEGYECPNGGSYKRFMVDLVIKCYKSYKNDIIGPDFKDAEDWCKGSHPSSVPAVPRSEQELQNLITLKPKGSTMFYTGFRAKDNMYQDFNGVPVNAEFPTLAKTPDAILILTSDGAYMKNAHTKEILCEIDLKEPPPPPPLQVYTQLNCPSGFQKHTFKYGDKCLKLITREPSDEKFDALDRCKLQNWCSTENPQAMPLRPRTDEEAETILLKFKVNKLEPLIYTGIHAPCAFNVDNGEGKPKFFTDQSNEFPFVDYAIIDNDNPEDPKYLLAISNATKFENYPEVKDYSTHVPYRILCEVMPAIASSNGECGKKDYAIYHLNPDICISTYVYSHVSGNGGQGNDPHGSGGNSFVDEEYDYDAAEMTTRFSAVLFLLMTIIFV